MGKLVTTYNCTKRPCGANLFEFLLTQCGVVEVYTISTISIRTTINNQNSK